MARGVSARYPTSGSKVIIDDLLGASGESQPHRIIHWETDCVGHGTLLGASTAKAHEEAALTKKRPLKKKPSKAKAVKGASK